MSELDSNATNLAYYLCSKLHAGAAEEVRVEDGKLWVGLIYTGADIKSIMDKEPSERERLMDILLRPMVDMWIRRQAHAEGRTNPLPILRDIKE